MILSNTTTDIVDHGMRIEVLLPNIIMIISAIFGDFGNASIVWVTYRNKHLQNSCNLLIASNALVDLVHQCAHFIYAYFLISGITYTTKLTCWYLMQLELICFANGIIFIVLVGVDRALSVLCLIMYKNLNSFIYMSICLSIPLIYSIFFLVFSYIEVLTMANEPVACHIGTVTPPTTSNILNYSLYVLQIAMVVVYLVLWISFILKKNQSSSSKRVIKSISAILIVILISWPGSTLLGIIVEACNLFNGNLEMEIGLKGILINFGVSANYYIYYIFSKEYRAAFRKQLSFLPCCKNSNIVSVVTYTNAVSGHRSKVQKI